MSESYHLLYENRYKKVYEAGVDYWGHTPDDEELTQVLTEWVNQHNLKGKRIIEFFCGEGASGVILAKLGCMYHGVDISPSALQTAEKSLKDYPHAAVSQLNVVSGEIDGLYDAALDVMGFHMLVTDTDRVAYLKNALSCLKGNAPMLFFREISSKDANDSFIGTYDEWLKVSKGDYTTLHQRTFTKDGKAYDVQIPLVPGRQKTQGGYIKEISEAGFIVDSVVDMELNNKCGESVSIYVRRPK